MKLREKTLLRADLLVMALLLQGAERGRHFTTQEAEHVSRGVRLGGHVRAHLQNVISGCCLAQRHLGISMPQATFRCA